MTIVIIDNFGINGNLYKKSINLATQTIYDKIMRPSNSHSKTVTGKPRAI